MIVTIEYEDGHKIKFDTLAVGRTKRAWEEVCDLLREAEDSENAKKDSKQVPPN